MPRRLRLLPLLVAIVASGAMAQGSDLVQPSAATDATVQSSVMDAQLFYQLLLGELNARGPDAGAGYSFILDAARRTRDAALFRRAVEIAFQARSADAALGAVRAWADARPNDREPHRFHVQILVALNRLDESVEPLRAEIRAAAEGVPAGERAAAVNAALVQAVRHYGRAADKAAAAAVVERALSAQLADPSTAAVAWAAVGRLRLAAGDGAGALAAARAGQALDPASEAPALLALELMEPRQPEAEAIVRRYVDGQPLPEVRMGYARALLDAQRFGEAGVQLAAITRERPGFAEAWLVQGSLQIQDNQLASAEASLRRFLELVAERPASEDKSRGQAQAYLGLAQIAERRGELQAAEAWLNRIENADDLVGAQTRRASILARQGRMDQARALLRSLPGRNAAEQRARVLAEVQLLREHKLYRAAYELLDEALSSDPNDPDLLYDKAMMAEKLRDFDDMERLLRRIIATRPDYHHAYNALGYSLADRNLRLTEAKTLIEKALTYAPGDPYITDSLGWVEFRMGNRETALRILETAYKARPDAEIAAHLGEVLWSLSRRDQARAVWAEGLLLNPENETLIDTMRRFGAQR